MQAWHVTALACSQGYCPRGPSCYVTGAIFLALPGEHSGYEHFTLYLKYFVNRLQSFQLIQMHFQ